MAEYRQPKNTLKKQVSLMLPTEIYEGAKRDAKKYNRSMAYHIVETLRITFSEAIQEVQTEREQAAKINILEQFKVQAQSEGRSQNWLTLLESIFWKFAESKPAEDLGPDFLPDLFTFVTIMEESHKT
ncbi:MAG: hypothetical protein VX830_05360 [Candidatus Poribacteria bacterium]|nr:hypothetical protein [Candidatus Poribacteria bacterium]|tara:strand:+ start:78 stop:461 length:384 start_codon:yes stop_codon:yes gene_type:complete